jgi:hypothetical protein
MRPLSLVLPPTSKNPALIWGCTRVSTELHSSTTPVCEKFAHNFPNHFSQNAPLRRRCVEHQCKRDWDWNVNAETKPTTQPDRNRKPKPSISEMGLGDFSPNLPALVDSQQASQMNASSISVARTSLITTTIFERRRTQESVSLARARCFILAGVLLRFTDPRR